MTQTAPAFASNAGFEFEPLEQARNYRSALMRRFGPRLRGHVLEVGAGVGHFTALLRGMASISRITAVEPDPGFAAKLKELLPEESVVAGAARSLPENFACDAIVCVNVLEHIEHDAAELETFHRLLRSARGALCLFVPARPEIYAPIDRDFGHFRRYTRKELRGKLERAGFQIEQLRYFNLAGYFAWWWSFCVMKQRRFSPGAVRVFDRFIFPCVNFWETNVLPPPIGQSLIAVAVAQ